MDIATKPKTAKTVGFYVNQALQSLLRAAGISPHFKPELEYLPTLSLIKVEIVHLIFHHIMPSMTKCSKQSMKYFNHMHVQNILQCAWNKLIQHQYRPKLSPKTAMKNSNCGTAVQLKSVIVYQTFWEYILMAKCLGFRILELTLLQRFVQWVGRLYAPNNNNKRMDKLMHECHQICHDIETIPSMSEEFVSKPSLRVWRNFVDINWYWIDLPKHYFGLMYENKHKFTKYFYLTKSKSTVKHMLKKRLLKDITAQAMGIQNHNQQHCMGSGISQLWLNYTNDNRMTESVHKINSYIFNNDTNQYDFKNDNENLNESPFIGMLAPKILDIIAWIKLKNKIIKSPKKSDWPTNLININKTDLTKILQRKKMHIICQYINTIINCVTIDNANYDLQERINIFLNGLITGVLTITRFDGFQTFYREWTDSNIRNDDCVWFRQPHCDGMVTVKSVLRLQGLTNSELNECLNNNFTRYDMNDLYLLNGKLWCNNEIKTYNLNFETMNIENMPQLKETQNQITISVEWVIQKLYVAHDHIIPCKEDQKGIYMTNKPWPNPNESHLPENRHIKLNIDPKKQYMSWCGIGWICNCVDAKVNCEKCLQSGEHAGGNIIFQCQTTLWPYYKAYSIYQGFIPRLFSARMINELT